MSPGRTRKSELKIFTPISHLGQGWNEQIFWQTLESGVDAIIVYGASTDSDPGRLALGKTNVPRAGLERDLKAMAKACHIYKVPILIGSAGGDGENAFVDLCVDIIQEAIKANGYRSMQLVLCYSPCGGGVPELTDYDIDSATRIVEQMGLEPFLKAMQENPDFDIIVGGRAYNPAPYAAFCLYYGFNRMGVNYAMGKVMECGAFCSIPKSRESLAIIRDDNFHMVPLDPKSVCTEVSVASHFLYEKSRPGILKGPGGGIHLADATYEQIDERSVRVRNPIFVPEPEGEYTDVMFPNQEIYEN